MLQPLLLGRCQVNATVDDVALEALPMFFCKYHNFFPFALDTGQLCRVYAVANNAAL